VGKRKSGSTIGSPRSQERKQAEKEARRQKRRTQRVLRGTLLAAVVLALGGGMIYAAQQRAAREYDLTVIGSGVPAVVQVHDVTCPFCNDLRANVRAIEGEFDADELHLKIADIATEEGLRFAARHTEQRRVTLLYFDGAGQLTDVQSGVRTPEELRDAFRAHIEADR
jgi:hypothetical protein